MLNGQVEEPTLFGAPTFEEYDLSAVRVSFLRPAAAPVARPNAVTVHGSGFASYGPGQLVCRAGGDSGKLVRGHQAAQVSLLHTIRESHAGESGGPVPFP